VYLEKIALKGVYIIRLPQRATLGLTLGLEMSILCKLMQNLHKNYLFRIVYAYLRVFSEKKSPRGPTLMG